MKTHVHALQTGARTVAPWSDADALREKQVEKQMLGKSVSKSKSKILQSLKMFEESLLYTVGI